MKNFLRQPGFKIKCSAVYKVAPGKSSPNRSKAEVLPETGGGALSTLSHSAPALNGDSRATLLVSFSHIRHFPQKIRNGLWLGGCPYTILLCSQGPLTLLTTRNLGLCEYESAVVKPDARSKGWKEKGSLCLLCTEHNQYAYPIELQDVTKFRTQGGNMLLNCAL